MSHDVDDDAYVLMRWLSELSNPTPDCGRVAALEVIAEDRGWHPYDAWDALRRRTNRPVVAASFDPDAHPRGHDGRFIELGRCSKSSHQATTKANGAMSSRSPPTRTTPATRRSGLRCGTAAPST